MRRFFLASRSCFSVSNSVVVVGKRTWCSIMASYFGRALFHNSCSRWAMASVAEVGRSRREVMGPASPR